MKKIEYVKEKEIIKEKIYFIDIILLNICKYLSFILIGFYISEKELYKTLGFIALGIFLIIFIPIAKRDNNKYLLFKYTKK